MHGLVNLAIQRFVTDTYSPTQWSACVAVADLDFTSFEAMLSYEDSLTTRVLAAACGVLDRNYDELLEDIGTYLVSHPEVGSVRRLLRFGGVDFIEFLRSLDDLPDRARLAVPDLILPPIELREHTRDRFIVMCCCARLPGFGHLVTGVIRAMADDYGTLAYLEHRGGDSGMEMVAIDLLQTDFARGRDFWLGAGAP